MSLTVHLSELTARSGDYEFVRTTPAGSDVGVPLMAVPEGQPVQIDLRLSALEEGVFVQGTVAATAKGQCSRCLVDLTVPMEEAVAELVFYPERQEQLIAEGDEEARDLPVVVDDEVDIEPLLRDSLVLAMPLNPLCEPDCPGLCTECGQRWVELPDDHEHEVLDPRFSALDELAEQLRAQEAEARGE
ncbi:YceD family protein [Trueperella bialowiezensis]|uniref:Uncharacterized ACR, COG1399 n=1 Tax=Trueperella bialowiezensis TaxID=312285 RepID=A0A448PGK4_9ACTO|nr:YceD family protein [Trueperella bialowiezensis]VEI14036.1 Uncharacterized ACR, COG1399 [Trueperella bialowiezensis]